jgi:hypothetical protein
MNTFIHEHIENNFLDFGFFSKDIENMSKIFLDFFLLFLDFFLKKDRNWVKTHVSFYKEDL